MYKLIACDMDGTLLTSDGVISEKTLKSIRLAEKAGVIFVPASGRAPAGLLDFRNILNPKAPFIAYNGCYAEANGEVIFDVELTNGDAEKIISVGHALQASMFIWAKNRLYTNATGKKRETYEKMAHVRAAYTEDFSFLIPDGITKVLWFEDEAKIAEIKQKLDPRDFENMTWCTSCSFFLEFFSSDASKGTALLKLIEKLGLDKKDTIAIGDGENDISMLDAAALAVAMSNASDAVKECADYITDTNDNNGVGSVIEKFILN